MHSDRHSPSDVHRRPSADRRPLRLRFRLRLPSLFPLLCALFFGVSAQSAVANGCGEGAAEKSDEPDQIVLHPPVGALYPKTDPDMLELLEATARRALRTGEWDRILKAREATLRRAADEPLFSPSLPRETASRLSVRRVLWSPSDEARLRRLLGTHERRFLFLDGTDPAQTAFAARLLGADRRDAEKGEGPAEKRGESSPFGGFDVARLLGLPKGSPMTPLRVVLLKGRRSEVEPRLRTRVWFDRAGTLTSRLGITALPALARIGFDERRLLQAALLPDGTPKERDVSDVLRFDSVETVRPLGDPVRVLP